MTTEQTTTRRATAEQAIVDRILAAGSGEPPQPDAPQLTAPADSKYINAVLNSELGRWFARQLNSGETDGARTKEMPMPHLKAGERQELVDLVDEVAAMSEAERRADARNTVLALNDLILDFYQIEGEEEGVIYTALGLHIEIEDAGGDVGEKDVTALRAGDAS